MKKSGNFDIFNYKHITEEFIKENFERIGSSELKKTGHGFDKYGAITIKEATDKWVKIYSNKQAEKPAIGLIDVVLAANRNYNRVVAPNLKRIEKDYPNLKTFEQLNDLLNSKSKEEFYDFWGHRNERKYNVLLELLLRIKKLKSVYPKVSSDFELMNTWAKNVDILNYKNDIFGDIPNVALATIQHLRMVFGVNTIKPDQRVKEVLINEFKIPRINNEKVIKSLEQIASIMKKDPLTVDQYFVKYGSSYYVKLKK